MLTFFTTVTALLCLALDGGPTPEWRVVETEIYQPLGRREIAVTPDSGFYLLNKKECKISRYNGKGERIAVFGKKGQGPGEFGYPMALYFDEDKLYVHDLVKSAIVGFDAQGKFIKNIPLPSRGLELHKVKGGWVYGSWMFQTEQQKDAEIIWADDDLNNQTVLHSWRPDTEAKSTRVVIEHGQAAIPFNPARETPNMTVSQDGRYLALSIPGPNLNIHIFDVIQKKPIAAIKKDLQRIPFNEDWANAALEKAKERQTQAGRGIKMDFKPNYPSHFPIVRSLHFMGDGNLYVERWSGTPETRLDYLVLDIEGNQADTTLPFEAVARVSSIQNEYALVTTFDQEEEQAGLAYCKRADLKAFITANPIKFESIGGDQIMIMN